MSTMMGIADLLAPTSILLGFQAQDKDSVLAELSRRAGKQLGIDPAVIFAALTKREGLGSTGVGAGIGLPHARIADLTRPFGLFARLKRPIDFDSVDEASVDLIFLVLLPGEQSGNQVSAIACVARRLRQPSVAQALRNAKDITTAYDTLTQEHH